MTELYAEFLALAFTNESRGRPGRREELISLTGQRQALVRVGDSVSLAPASRPPATSNQSFLQCQIRTFIPDEVLKSVVYDALSSSSSAFASLRSAVSKPSVNRP
jgi:hypothetical protein